MKSRVELRHISDHYLVISILKLKLPKPLPNYMVTRTFKKYSPEQFTSGLAQIIWEDNSIYNDVNKQTEKFNHKSLSILNMHAPVKTTKIKSRLCSFIGKENMKKRN